MAEWSVQATVSLSTIDTHSPSIGTASAQVQAGHVLGHGWSPPGSPQPGRPALIPTQGTWLCSSHNSTLGVIALFVGSGGGASCRAQWSLNPKVPPTPSWSSAPPWSRVLAGKMPGLVESNWLRPSSTGLGPLPPSPRSPEPSAHASLQLQHPALPCLGSAMLLRPPQGLGSGSAAAF